MATKLQVLEIVSSGSVPVVGVYGWRTGRLVRLTDNDHTRTREMVGWYRSPPTVGRSFVILNDDPLDTSNGENMRAITTSPVREVKESEDGILFTTQNTEYLLEALEDEQ